MLFEINKLNVFIQCVLYILDILQWPIILFHPKTSIWMLCGYAYFDLILTSYYLYTQVMLILIYRMLFLALNFFIFCLSLCLSIRSSVHHAPYLRNCTSSNHNFWYTCVKWWYLRAVISFFWKFYFSVC